MKKTYSINSLSALIFSVCAVFLTACGESHTYSGVLKRTGLGGSEGKVNITIKKQSDKEATMTIIRDGNNDTGLFLADCIYPIKLQQDDFQGKVFWNPDYCYLKGEFGDKSVSLTANAGDFQVNGKQLQMKVVTDLATDRENRFEFVGTEK
jgi:hypothetical protein